MSLENSSLCFIKINYVPKASIIIFNNVNFAEYFLGCLSNPEDKLNSMLGILSLTASHFRDKCKEFYLGGGRSCDPEDSLLKYKSGIGSIKRSYFIGHNLYNKKIYQQLKNKRIQVTWQIELYFTEMVYEKNMFLPRN